MIFLLGAVLVILLVVIGGERGAITFFSLGWNLLVLTISILAMSWGISPILVTFISCLLISYITLFYQNGKNAKTIASFAALLIGILILFFLTYEIGYDAKLRGLSEILQREDEVFGLSADIQVSMAQIAVSMILIGLMGAVMDTSIAVSSAVYEVYKNNRHLSVTELFRSGMAIGRDILGTTINTLYFAYLGESMMLFLLFKNFHYSVLDVINSKAFFQEVAAILLSGIGCVMMIPLTSSIISYLLKNPGRFQKLLNEDELFSNH
ncbi:YibE/F family protein [Sinanaerobacter chloroacetimidivorans]|uniref:YibE/F family protein n=1 Tax=Sinanaerobacter chloroacetimidivorans TaxID=2818044 RepID=A0A8J8B160_9FIRM|nr:YibE/F family protein [Sinanaerobacter chloroacetimidivorans]MBR0598358.1 YibE/F family protein [Sinanaerobacter chloroacetimidivorans]